MTESIFTPDQGEAAKEAPATSTEAAQTTPAAPGVPAR